ncbi:MAG: hypothetical protein AB1896_00885 [Thermodesulfobacteriota bacterium]
MTRRRKVDASKVIEAVESGRLSKDVMDSFGLEKPSPAYSRRGRRGRRGRGAGTGAVITESLGDITISKRGSLVLPKALVEELGFGLDDVFVARKTKAGLLLKPINTTR